MPFFDPQQIDPVELCPGVATRLMGGVNLMLSLVDLEPGSVVPLHSHPHEQSGYVVSGQVEFRIGEETKLLGPGQMLIVPPNVPHGVRVVSETTARVLDVFSPPRQEYLAKTQASR